MTGLTARTSVRRRWLLTLTAVLGAGAVAWVVFGLVMARFGAEPLGEVVRSVGRLEPFTRPLPTGSVVMLGSDTLGLLDSFVLTEASSRSGGENLVLVKGRLLRQSDLLSQRAPTLVGRLPGAWDSAGPLVVVLDTLHAAVTADQIGVLVLEPGGTVIRLLSDGN